MWSMPRGATDHLAEEENAEGEDGLHLSWPGQEDVSLAAADGAEGSEEAGEPTTPAQGVGCKFD